MDVGWVPARTGQAVPRRAVSHDVADEVTVACPLSVWNHG